MEKKKKAVKPSNIISNSCVHVCIEKNGRIIMYNMRMIKNDVETNENRMTRGSRYGLKMSFFFSPYIIRVTK